MAKDAFDKDLQIISEEEDQANLLDFKTSFQERIFDAAKKRYSHQDVPSYFRRLDSLARLLEGKSICAAVYYHVPSNMIWLASNKIFNGSHLTNKQIEFINMVCTLISTEDFSIPVLVEKLSHIIATNFAQEQRFSIEKLKKKFDYKNAIKKWLNKFFVSGLTTKNWRDQTITNLKCSADIKNIVIELIRKTAKLTRDFLKLHAFAHREEHDNILANKILTAMKEGRFQVIHVEGKNVHAEMRIIAKSLESTKNESEYIGISKLCCDHCAVSVAAFTKNYRGVHGQGAKWPVPEFITKNITNARKYMGEKAFSFFERLPAHLSKEAIRFMSLKEVSKIKEDARHGRSMLADSSESDLAFEIEEVTEGLFEDMSDLFTEKQSEIFDYIDTELESLCEEMKTCRAG